LNIEKKEQEEGNVIKEDHIKEDTREEIKEKEEEKSNES
jgi:hypothetical protein